MRSGGKSRKQKTSSRHKSGQQMLEGVKEAFHLKKPSEKGSHKMLEAATKHNSKTIEKLNKLLLKKTKKIERYKSQHKKERRQSSSSSSDSSSSDDSKDDEINMMLHKLHLEAKMNDLSRNRQDYRQDYRQDHRLDYRQDYRQDHRQYNKNIDPYNFGETYDDTYDDPSSFRNRSSLQNKRNARVSFVVKRGYTTQNALPDFTVAQRNEITRYVNAFCRYLEEKMIIEQNINKASIANSVIRVDIYIDSADRNKIKQSLTTYSRSNPFPYQNYRLEVASVS